MGIEASVQFDLIPFEVNCANLRSQVASSLFIATTRLGSSVVGSLDFSGPVHFVELGFELKVRMRVRKLEADGVFGFHAAKRS